MVKERLEELGGANFRIFGKVTHFKQGLDKGPDEEGPDSTVVIGCVSGAEQSCLEKRSCHATKCLLD